MNLQTFDSKNEVASYLKESFFDEYFQDIAQVYLMSWLRGSIISQLISSTPCLLTPLAFWWMYA